MSKRLWGACLALAMGWACASGPRSEAKPPDLPVSPDVACPEGRVDSGTEHEGSRAPEPSVDVSYGHIADLSWLEALLPSLPARAQSTEPNGSQSGRKSQCDPAREEQIERYRQAQRIYILGLDYQQNGHLSKARTCFQEAHLISPETRYGKLAIERLHYLEMEHPARPGAEEAEEPERPANSRQVGESSRYRFQKMIQETAPLGTVPLDSH